MGRRLVKRPEDRLAVCHGQRHDLRLDEEGVGERPGDVLEAARAEHPGELEHVLVDDRNAGELHPIERTSVRVAGEGRDWFTTKATCGRASLSVAPFLLPPGKSGRWPGSST